MAFMLRYLVFSLVIAGLAGCSLFPNHRLDYQYVEVTDELTLPPGLDMNNNRPVYPLPDKGPLLDPSQRGKFELPAPAVMASIEQRQQQLQQTTQGPAPKVEEIHSEMTVDGNGYPMIMIHTSFDWSWEYVADALAKAQLTIRDRNRQTGTYFIRQPKAKDKKQADIRIVLSSTTNGTQVVAMDKDGEQLLSREEGGRTLSAIYAGL